MIRKGSTTFWVEREVCLPDGEITYKKIQLDVDWVYSCCEYGDGSEDSEFVTFATDRQGQKVELDSAEELRLMEELRDSGEFA